jgi:hypothetical protein
MKTPMFLSTLLFTAAAFAAQEFSLDLGASVQSGSLTVEPTVTGPAGTVVNYEMKVRREGKGKSSDSSQGGTVRLDGTGHAPLASNSISVSPGDRYVITVRVMDHGRLVAEKSQRYP